MRLDLRSGLLVLATAILVAAGTVAATVKVLQTGLNEAPAPAHVVHEEPRPELFAEPMTLTVNLTGESRPTYLRVTVVFELSNKGALEEFERLRPTVQDRAISLLREQRVADLVGRDKLEAVKRQLKAAVDPLVARKGTVAAVYFTELVTQ